MSARPSADIDATHNDQRSQNLLFFGCSRSGVSKKPFSEASLDGPRRGRGFFSELFFGFCVDFFSRFFLEEWPADTLRQAKSSLPLFSGPNGRLGSVRYMLAGLFFINCALLYAMRLNLSVSITAMVNTTKLDVAPTSNFTCRDPHHLVDQATTRKPSNVVGTDRCLNNSRDDSSSQRKMFHVCDEYFFRDDRLLTGRVRLG